MQTVFAFCEDENIKDIDNFMYLCFKQGFDIKRYGLLGKTLNVAEKDLKIGGEQEKNGTVSVRRHGQDGKGNITVSIDEFAALVNEEVQKTLKTFEV